MFNDFDSVDGLFIGLLIWLIKYLVKVGKKSGLHIEIRIFNKKGRKK